MSYRRMTLQERLELFKEHQINGRTNKEIASKLNRSESTISRELKRGEDSGYYNPFYAETVHLSMRRYQCPFLKIDNTIWKKIKKKLELRWSPNQIAEWLKNDYPEQTVCEKTIYNYIHFHMKGELKKIALKDLRQKGKKRKSSDKTSPRRGKLKDMTLIDERPVEVNAREVPGHWEGDLIIGKDHKSAICVIVERKTRFIQLDLLEKYDAYSVRKKIENRFKKLEPELRKTLTLDQGKENSQHRTLSKNIALNVYFCHPHSPWEKGTCENTNFLIRDMLDGVDDFRELNQYKIGRKLLNERPRKTLGYKTPKNLSTIFVE